MAIYFPEVEEIYFEKTRGYFQEVVSSYANGNYRSATVMLYSVAICDMLFKLQELKDMYNDTIAKEILDEVDKARNEHDKKSKSRWEKEFVDNVYKKTELLDMEVYTNLNHLYDNRNFSAHPALNENYELIAPSKETTVANIKNILNGILIKPPVFIKRIVGALTEDLKGKREVYRGEEERLAFYLNNKYYSKMTEAMKEATLKALWKFCFCLPEDEDCKENFYVNRKALTILIEGFQQNAMKYIKANSLSFTLANDKNCLHNMAVFLSEQPLLFDVLNVDIQLQIENFVKEEEFAKTLAWFKYKSAKEHFGFLERTQGLCLHENIIRYMTTHYETIGEMNAVIDFFIVYYGRSVSYDSSDEMFGLIIEPYLKKMKAHQFEELIRVSNTNSQIYNRNRAMAANNAIMRVAKDVLPKSFDYEQYTHFYFDKSLLNDEDNSKELDDSPQIEFE